MYVCMYGVLFVCMYMCKHVYGNTSLSENCSRGSRSARIYTYTYNIYVLVSSYIYTDMYLYVYLYMHVHMNVYMETRILWEDARGGPGQHTRRYIAIDIDR